MNDNAMAAGIAQVLAEAAIGRYIILIERYEQGKMTAQQVIKEIDKDYAD